MITTSHYPQISAQFGPKFVTHDDDSRVGNGDFVVVLKDKSAATELFSRALVAVLISRHPRFPVA